jgi:hypothetical protein
MYEGRTRGKRMKYTYSDDEDQYTDGPDTRRSARGQGFPGLPTGPMTTASGRQVRTRYGNLFGTHEHAGHDSEGSVEPNANGRATRSSRNFEEWEQHHDDADDLNDDGDSVSSGHDWQGEDEAEDQVDDDEDQDMTDVSDEDMEPQSLIVTLQYRKELKKEVDATVKGEDLSKPTLLTPTTSSNGFVPKLEEKPIAQLPILPTPPNGLEVKPAVAPQQQQHTVHTTLPSFSKFLYSPANGGQTDAPVQPLHAQPQPTTFPAPTQRPQPQPSTTSEVNHHRPW